MTLEVLSRPSLIPINNGGQLQTVARRPRRNVLDLDDFSVQEIEAVASRRGMRKAGRARGDDRGAGRAVCGGLACG